MIRQVYRKIKYIFFTTPEKEYINFHKRRRDGLIQEYLRQHPVRKLQIGAQSNSIEGWLNVDILPKSHTVAYMDATERFPVADNTFDYIFSEHMIEHITFDEGAFMLRECFRTLKPGGRVRIATPNLSRVVRIMDQPEAPEHAAYIRFYVDRFKNGQVPYDPVYVLNELFYNFGHRFIYTESSLRLILERAGFTSIARAEVGKSADQHLNRVEQHAVEIGEANNLLETLVMEAIKPL